jgi:hypothetical protein
MAGLVPAIHVFSLAIEVKTWMPGTRPGMTGRGSAPQKALRSIRRHSANDRHGKQSLKKIARLRMIKLSQV